MYFKFMKLYYVSYPIYIIKQIIKHDYNNYVKRKRILFKSMGNYRKMELTKGNGFVSVEGEFENDVDKVYSTTTIEKFQNVYCVGHTNTSSLNFCLK